MKINFILPLYTKIPIGGYRVIYEYANNLSKRGHEVIITYPHSLPNWKPQYEFYQKLFKKIADLKNMIIKSKNKGFSLYEGVESLRIKEITTKYLPDSDVIFATFWPIAEIIKDLPPGKGQKFYLVQDFDDYFGPQKRLEHTWRLPFKKITVSSWLYEKVKSIAGSQDLVNIPNGIDHGIFRKIKEFNDRPPRILAMYSTVRYKKIEDCIKALEISRLKYNDCRITMFGTARPRTLPNWIEYRHNISDEMLVVLYNESSIFVCSSVAEGFAFPPAEAMACGCALASTDCGGNREYAEHGVTALLSPPNDPEALAANIIKLLKDENLRIKLSQAGYERIKQFTWDKSTDYLEAFILKNLQGCK